VRVLSDVTVSVDVSYCENKFGGFFNARASPPRLRTARVSRSVSRVRLLCVYGITPRAPFGSSLPHAPARPRNNNGRFGFSFFSPFPKREHQRTKQNENNIPSYAFTCNSRATTARVRNTKNNAFGYGLCDVVVRQRLERLITVWNVYAPSGVPMTILVNAVCFGFLFEQRTAIYRDCLERDVRH